MRPLRVIATVLLLVVGCAKSGGTEDEDVPLPPRGDLPDGEVILKTDASVDAGANDASTDAADAGPQGTLVFVSSTLSNANLGGLAGADTRCTTLATAAGLDGTWVAWLSNGDNGPHAADRVTSAGPFRLRSGEVIANSKLELLTGVLRHPINRDENGQPVVASRVWTGSGADGRYSTNDCDKWRSGNDGRVGETSSATATWTSAGVDGCGQQRRIYCFQR